MLVKKGWLSLTPTDDAQERKDPTPKNPIPVLEQGAVLAVDSADVQAKKTKAPKRFTKSALIDELERRGIGRPSTFAAIIKNIEDKGYVTTNDKRFLIPTKTGEEVVDTLKDNFLFMEYSFTETMENNLDGITEGKASYLDVVKTTYDLLETELTESKKTLKPKYPCPSCGSAMQRRKGKNGLYGVSRV